MIEIIFGFVFGFASLFVVFTILTDMMSSGFYGGGIISLLFMLFWLFISGSLLFKGLKKIFINIKTDTSGFTTYAIVTDVYESGTYVNDNPEWKSDFKVIDKNGNLVDCSEIVGFNEDKYPAGSFVRVKYHNGDINILESVPESQISNITLLDYKKILVAEIENEKLNGNNSFKTSDTYCAEIIVINGIKYQRGDLYKGPPVEDTIIEGIAYKRIK